MKRVTIPRILMTALLVSACMQQFAWDSASAAQLSRSVQEDGVTLLAGAVNAASVEEEWREVCRRSQSVPFPAEDRPTAKAAAALAECSSHELYYGFDQAADPVKARLCAYHELEHRRGDGPFSGSAMLMTIYANGLGARRNLPLALRLACTLDGAPAEMEGRIAHLERLRKQNWRGKDFSLCDDITSGLMQGYCADHFERFARSRRDQKLKAILATWTDGEKAAYAPLRKAALRYFAARVEHEVDQSGTARAAMAVEEEAALEEGFIASLQSLERGKLPKGSGARFADADSNLNAVYQRLQGRRDTDSWGTVSREGIKAAQREWIRYRDAWAAFCRKKYPMVDPKSAKTWLTVERTELLQQFLE